jgi:hypothetical protein
VVESSSSFGTMKSENSSGPLACSSMERPCDQPCSVSVIAPPHRACKSMAEEQNPSHKPATGQREPSLFVGQIYSVVPGGLAFAAFASHSDAEACQEKFPHMLFVSGDFHDLYQPFSADFGPVNLGVIHSFCEFMRKFSDCPKQVVYYSVCVTKLNFHLFVRTLVQGQN